jgi:hypothetical protein
LKPPFLRSGEKIYGQLKDIESAMQIVYNPHECSLSGVNLAARIP